MDIFALYNNQSMYSVTEITQINIIITIIIILGY